MNPRIGSLFSGAGGLDLAVETVLGGHTVWHCDDDPAATRLLAHHWPEAPNLGDITRVGLPYSDDEWAAMKHRAETDPAYELPAPDWTVIEPVDVLTGGFPCQDVSAAGRRAGMTPDTRSGLWTHMSHAIAVLRPRMVVIENVRGLLSSRAHRDVELDQETLGDSHVEPVLRAAGAVLGDLASLGFDADWSTVRASDVGAPHQRARVFIVAHRRGSVADTGGEGHRPGSLVGRAAGTSVVGDRAPATADTGHGRVPERARPQGRKARQRSSERDEPRRDCGATTSDADSLGSVRTGRSRRRRGGSADDDRFAGSDYAPAIHRWERVLGRQAPAPTVPGARGGDVLSPRFVEWMQGLPAGWVTGIDGLSRNDQLRLLGNGVVPQQAGAALATLAPNLWSRRAAGAGVAEHDEVSG